MQAPFGLCGIWRYAILHWGQSRPRSCSVAAAVGQFYGMHDRLRTFRNGSRATLLGLTYRPLELRSDKCPVSSAGA